MKVKNNRQCQVFINVCEFAAQHPDVYPPNSYGRQLVVDLEAVVQDVPELTASQASGIGSAQRKSAAKARARNAVRESMAIMSATARGLTVTNPEIDNQFRLPRTTGDSALLHSARTFAKDAAPLVNEFVRFGMPPTFIEELNSNVKALERASADHKNVKETHVTATSAIEDVIEKGREILQQLDPITQNNLRGNTLMLAKWNKISRVTWPASRSKSSESGAHSSAEESATANATST